MSGIEGLGEVVTGGMAARAVEPDTGVDGEGRHAEHHGACLNCGSALAGAYCSRCGQPAHIHHTLGAFWHDLLHGVLHFEGKTWRTLPMLAWRPGELTRRYIDGERAKFVSPMALFLFSVFLMFAVFSSIGGPFTVESDPDLGAGMAAEARLIDGRLATLERERARRQDRGEPTEATEAAIASARQARAAIGILVDDPAARSNVPGVLLSDGRSGWPSLDKALGKARANPTLTLYKVQSNAYKFSWALIPLSVPFVALLFLWRRRHWRLYDHVVFVTYSIAFMTLLLIVLSLLRWAGAGGPTPVIALTIVPPVHMFWQLRGAYSLGVFSALWRTAALTLFATVALMLFLLLAVTLGMLG